MTRRAAILVLDGVGIGAAGALPPVVAYAAATGGMAIEPWVLFAIIFIWTPPHFWALSLRIRGDYEAAGVPMPKPKPKPQPKPVANAAPAAASSTAR